MIKAELTIALVNRTLIIKTAIKIDKQLRFSNSFP